MPLLKASVEVAQLVVADVVSSPTTPVMRELTGGASALWWILGLPVAPRTECIAFAAVCTSVFSLASFVHGL